jgi:hypothetical protein
MRNSLIGQTIRPDDLMGALGMSRATMDSARVAGALVGATLSTALGVPATYAFVVIFYAVGLALTFGIAQRPSAPDPSASPRRAVAGPSGWRSQEVVHVDDARGTGDDAAASHQPDGLSPPAALLPYVAQRIITSTPRGSDSWWPAFPSACSPRSAWCSRAPRHPERATLRAPRSGT